MIKKISASCVLLLAFAAAAVAAPAQKKADLSRLVVIGDSLAAGYQNGSLLGSQQVHGFASLLASRAGVSLPLPLIADPGIPNVFVLQDPGPPPVISRAAGSSSGRIEPLLQPMDLAVPGAYTHDALATVPTPAFTTMTDIVLGLPGLLAGVSRSQVEWAEALAPTTVLLWIGNMDALGAVIVADPAALTPLAAFKADYAAIMRRLKATGATLAVANIPDVTVIPYMVPAAQAAALAGAPLEYIGPALGIGAEDFVTLDALPVMQEILTGAAAGPLPGSFVVTASELATIRAAVKDFNAFIAQQAEENGAVLVDVNALLTDMQTRGYVVGGQRLTTDFLGGIFSLDGIHPTNTGHATVANEFIRALNTHFAAGIPPVSVEKVAAEDPLVLPGVGHPAAADRIRSEIARSARKTLVH